MEELADRIYREIGPVRLLVNNAGIEQFGYLWDTPVANWQRIVDINISGVFYGVRAFLPKMMASDEQAWVWNLSSVGGVVAIPLQAPYIVSKHAVLALTESLYLDVQSAGHGHHIHVQAVLPGPVVSNIFESAGGVESGEARDVACGRGPAFGHARHQGGSHGSGGGRRGRLRAGGRGTVLPAHPPGHVGAAMAERANVLAAQRPPMLRTESRFGPAKR